MPPPETDERGSFITREEASNIALAAAKEAVRASNEQLFGLLGVNIADFKAMQEFRDTLEWAAKGKKLSAVTAARMWTTIVGIASASIAIGLWEWFRTAILHKP